MRELNGIIKARIIYMKRGSRGNKLYGRCIESSNTIIVIKKKIKEEFVEVTICHEWLHLLQYQTNKDSYGVFRPSRYSPPADSYANYDSKEEECEAFALLLAKKSKDYNLNCIFTRMWLVRMWFALRENYPVLRDLLEKHRPLFPPPLQRDSDGDRSQQTSWQQPRLPY